MLPPQIDYASGDVVHLYGLYDALHLVSRDTWRRVSRRGVRAFGACGAWALGVRRVSKHVCCTPPEAIRARKLPPKVI